MIRRGLAAINPRLLVPGNIERTAQNIVVHGRRFVAAILCYLITLILDVAIAWALYILLAPSASCSRSTA